ncbi:MAG: hypothetical protein RhofKO_20710 [Rhodothermales bacterium]
MATRLLDTPPEESFDRVTRLVTRLLHVPVALVSLVDDDRQFFKSAQGLPAPWSDQRETPLTHSFCQHVVQAEQTLAVEDARDHPLVHDSLAITDLNVIAYLGVPLYAPDGHAIGALCAIDGSPRCWSQLELTTLRELADFVMTEIDLREQMRRAHQHKHNLVAKMQILHQKNQTLKHQSAILKHFAQVASHDLHEPLRTVTSFAQLLQRRYAEGMDENGQQFIEHMVNGTEHMRGLLFALREFHDITNQPLKEDAVQLPALIAERFNQLRTLTGQAARLTLNALPEIHSDSQLVGDLLSHLMDNCFKFCSAEPLHISLTAEATEGTIHLALRDNGIGIDPEHCERVFLMFRRLHNRETYPGFGAGLALSKLIVDRLKGRIWITSNEGRAGLTVHIELPIALGLHDARPSVRSVEIDGREDTHIRNAAA